MRYYFDANYRETARLRDGTEVVLRLVQPGDKSLLRQGLENMSPESRYRRFLVPKSEFSDAELKYLTEFDSVDHLAIGALLPGRTGKQARGLGVARFVRLASKNQCADAAVAVIDAVQGKGLGGLLFQRLIAAARERGIRRFRCDVLGSNRAMQELIRELAPHRDVHTIEGVMTIEFDLPDLSPFHPAHEQPRASPAFRLLRMAANGMLEVRHALARMRFPKSGPRESEGPGR